jgi:hypothetical protein
VDGEENRDLRPSVLYVMATPGYFDDRRSKDELEVPRGSLGARARRVVARRFKTVVFSN